MSKTISHPRHKIGQTVKKEKHTGLFHIVEVQVLEVHAVLEIDLGCCAVSVRR
jgi:hypothetical protein